MIPKECKRLAEVDFPIAAVSRAVMSREKKFPVPRGLPSTMHQWWARRPLGSCRAVLLCLLLPDPCDRNCPAEFKKKARPLLSKVQGTPDADDQSLRKALLSFIATFSHWDTSANAQYLEVARNLVKAAYGDEALLVVDPFAGGGAIPLEALRVGCDALAGEINPVACLILKVLLDDIPRHGQELADALTKAGEGIQKVAEKELIQTH